MPTLLELGKLSEIPKTSRAFEFGKGVKYNKDLQLTTIKSLLFGNVGAVMGRNAILLREMPAPAPVTCMVTLPLRGIR